MSSTELSALISTLEKSVATSARGKHVLLNPPADQLGLLQLSAVLRIEVPRELREWLGIHDGESGIAGLLGESVFLMSAREIASAYNEMISGDSEDADDQLISVYGPARKRHTSVHWVPIANSDQETIMIDCDPAPGGDVGQIIFVDAAATVVEVRYPNLRQLFADANQ